MIPEFWGDLANYSSGDTALVRAFEIAARPRRSLQPIDAELRRAGTTWRIEVMHMMWVS